MQEIAQITLCSPRGGNTFLTSSVRTARIRLNCSSLLRPCRCEPCDVSFPPDVNRKILANEFGKFFEQKIENIHQTLDVLSVRPSDSDPNDVVLAAHAPRTTPSAPVMQPAAVMPHLTSFKSLSQEEVQALIAQ